MTPLTSTPMSSKYATIEEVGQALAALEQKVPSRWEVRTLILGAIVVTNFNVPDPVTISAVALGVVGLVGKAVLTLFRAS